MSRVAEHERSTVRHQPEILSTLSIESDSSRGSHREKHDWFCGGVARRPDCADTVCGICCAQRVGIGRATYFIASLGASGLALPVRRQETELAALYGVVIVI